MYNNINYFYEFMDSIVCRSANIILHCTLGECAVLSFYHKMTIDKYKRFFLKEAIFFILE